MEPKIKELIALAVSYAVNCHPCMEYHKSLALAAGLSLEEMMQAIQVAEQVKTGAGKKTKAVTKEMLAEVREEECCEPGSPCCS